MPESEHQDAMMDGTYEGLGGGDVFAVTFHFQKYLPIIIRHWEGLMVVDVGLLIHRHVRIKSERILAHPRHEISGGKGIGRGTRR